jgi:hypothetical protein
MPEAVVAVPVPYTEELREEPVVVVQAVSISLVMALMRLDLVQGVEVPHQPLMWEPEQVEKVAMVSSSSSTINP